MTMAEPNAPGMSSPGDPGFGHRWGRSCWEPSRLHARQNSAVAPPSTRALTCSASARCSMKCSAAGVRFAATRRLTLSSSILKKEPPDLSATGRDVPPMLERIVFHCLEKDPAARFQSAHDIAFTLEALSSISSPAALAKSSGRACLDKTGKVLARSTRCWESSESWLR